MTDDELKDLLKLYQNPTLIKLIDEFRAAREALDALSVYFPADKFPEESKMISKALGEE